MDLSSAEQLCKMGNGQIVTMRYSDDVILVQKGSKILRFSTTFNKD